MDLFNLRKPSLTSNNWDERGEGVEIKDLAERGMREIQFPKCLGRKKGNESLKTICGKIRNGERLGKCLEKCQRSGSHANSLRAQPLHNKASAVHPSFIKSAPNEP